MLVGMCVVGTFGVTMVLSQLYLPRRVGMASGLSIGLVSFSVYLYALRGFYVLQDTRTPFWINAIENAINIALAVALFPSLGVQGLAFVTRNAIALVPNNAARACGSMPADDSRSSSTTPGWVIK